MTILITFILVVVVWGGFKMFFPFIEFTECLPKKTLATNNAFIVKCNPFTDNYEGVLAKHFYEAKFKQNGWNLLKLLFNPDDTVRDMSFLSNEIRVSLSLRQDKSEYRRQVAKEMMVNYPELSGWDRIEIVNGMKDKKSIADKWVTKNIGNISYIISCRHKAIKGK